MTHGAELHFDRDMVRASAFACWRRALGLRLPIGTAILVAWTARLAYRVETGWIVGAMATVAAMACAAMASLFVVHHRNGLARLEDLQGGSATLLADDGTFTPRSGAGSATLPWTAVKQVWRYGRFWLVLLSRSQHFILPTRGLGVELRKHMLGLLTSAGARCR